MTTNATDATKYHENISNSETVTLTLFRLSGDSSILVEGALQRGLTTREANAIGVQIGMGNVVWNLPDEKVQSQGVVKEIRQGDRIVQSDGTGHRIVSDSANLSFNTRWRCITERERANNED